MSAGNSENVTCKKYKMVPPDGGWGYLICVAAVINFSTMTSFAACFGMIFKDYLIEIQMSSTNVALMAGFNAMSTAVAAFLTSPLLKIMSFRKLSLLAATVFNTGIFAVVFIKSQILFVIFQGILPGIGLGILYSLTLTILHDYFVTQRVFAISVVQTVTAVLAIVTPIFIKWSSDTYGHHGTLLLISGICFHIFLAVVIMQPVKWHMKKIEIPPNDQEMQILLVDEKPEKIPVVKLTDIEESVKTETEAIEEVDIQPKKQGVIMRMLSSIVDLSLCKTFMVSCAAFAPAAAVSADNIYALLLPQALYSSNWSQDDVAWALSICGFGDLAMRIVFVIIGNWIMKIGCQELYIIGILIGFLARLGIQWTHNFVALLFFNTIIGISRCITALLIPIVIAEVVRPEQFTEAFGLFFVAIGLINLVLSPAIGAVQDLTKSYSTAFYLLTSLYAILALFWSIELLYKRNKHKHVPRKRSGKTNKAIK